MATGLPQLPSDTPAKWLPTVLVVEDNSDDYFFLQRAFLRSGAAVNVCRAQDGAEGRAFLDQALSEGRLPVCIVADLVMPVMDGFEMLAYVKGNPALKSIPVVVLTTSNNERDITRAYQLGVNSYILKPNSFEGLLTVTAAIRDQWFRANIAPDQPPPIGRA